MRGTFKYYINYFWNIFILGFVDIITNRKKFKVFSGIVNDFKTGYGLSAESEYLKERELSEIIGDRNIGSPVLIENWVYRQGNVSLYELYCLCLITKAIEPAAIFEIGTFDGRTTLHFALNSPASTRINTLDLPPENLKTVKLKLDEGDPQLVDKKDFSIGQNFLNRPEQSKIIQHLSDSASFDYSQFAVGIDLFFVDGAHSYEYVKCDTENAFGTLKVGGFLLWHDYGNVLDVTRYLNKLSGEMPIFRIKHTSIAVSSSSLALK